MMNLRSWWKYVKRFLITAFAWFFVHTILIVYDGLTDETLLAEYAVVLGNKVDMNGRPSTRLQLRLDKAQELYEKGLIKKIIVSGGLGIEGFEEAEIMKVYLMKKQIPAENILVDRGGYTTYLTAQNARKLIADAQQNVIVVSHYYHITRTKLAFKQFGFSNVSGVHANLHVEIKEPYAIFREFIAYYYYLLRSYPNNE